MERGNAKQASDMSKPGKLVIITGPSGVGKSTIVREVRERTAAVLSVSATTRRPRPAEIDRQDYFFVDRDTFQSMVDAGEMLEWAEVFGEMYGTPAAFVMEALEAAKTVILEIDPQGAMKIARKVPDATFILIAPPGAEALAGRLERRGSETEREMAERLAKAAEEVNAARESGIFQHEIVNDDLDAAIREVVALVNRENPTK